MGYYETYWLQIYMQLFGFSKYFSLSGHGRQAAIGRVCECLFYFLVGAMTDIRQTIIIFAFIHLLIIINLDA
jgi:hypothetical protein